MEEKAPENDFPVRNNAASIYIIGNGVSSLLLQLQCHCNPDHDIFSSLSNTTVVKCFQMFVYGDVVYAQTWKVLTLKNCIEPLSYASTAYVVASYSPRFFSTVL